MSRLRFVDLPHFQSATTIEQRLTATLRRLRARKAGKDDKEPWDLNDDHALSYVERAKISRRADRVAKRRAMRAGIVHLKTEELARIDAVMPDIPLVMAGTEDWADAVAAQLHAEMPWMARATEHAWHALCLAARRGGPVAMRPVILNGPPGIGKSVWARKLGQALSLPMVDMTRRRAVRALPSRGSSGALDPACRGGRWR